MADLLEQVVAEIQKLPADQRDAIAARILTDLKPAFFSSSKASCPGLRTLALRSLSLQSPIQAC